MKNDEIELKFCIRSSYKYFYKATKDGCIREVEDNTQCD